MAPMMRLLLLVTIHVLGHACACTCRHRGRCDRCPYCCLMGEARLESAMTEDALAAIGIEHRRILRVLKQMKREDVALKADLRAMLP